MASTPKKSKVQTLEATYLQVSQSNGGPVREFVKVPGANWMMNGHICLVSTHDGPLIDALNALLEMHTITGQ